MAYNYPYGDTQQLNLNWFLAQWETFREQWATAEEGIDHALDAEIARVEAAMSDLYAARDAAAASQAAAQTAAVNAASSQTIATQQASLAQSQAATAQNQAGIATAAAEAAGNSASSASNSASNANLSKVQAGNSATAAGQSATLANEKATAAGLSAAQAGVSAANAAGSAEDSEAWAVGERGGTPVASGDDTYENNSKYYADQAAAVAASIPEDYTELSDDVSELKTAITQIGYETIPLEMGNISMSESGWSYSNSTTRVRIKQGTSIHLPVGSVIGLKSYDGKTMYIGWKKQNNTYGLRGWLNADFIVTEEGDYTVLMRLAPEAATTVSTFENELFIINSDSLRAQVVNNTKEIDELNTIGANMVKISNVLDGYFETNGVVYQGSYGEKYSPDFIPVEAGKKYTAIITANPAGTSFFRAITYSGNTTASRIGHITNTWNQAVFDYYANGLGYNKYTFEIPDGVSFIRVSWRAYGNPWIYLTEDKPLLADDVNTNRQNLMLFASADGSSHIKGINHTGYYTAPENTLSAFKLSRLKGFRYVECDVQFTSDNIPVILHDNTINRTARNSDGTELSETINIRDITYEQALQYDFGIYKGDTYAGTKIPSLEQFAMLCKQIGLNPYIEIKSGATEAQAVSAVNIIKKYGIINNVTFCSTNDTILGYIKTAYPKARLAFVSSTLTSSTISMIQALQDEDNEVAAAISYTALTDENVQLCVGANIPLIIWTLDAQELIASINPYVSGVISNRFNVDYIFYGLGLTE